MLNLKRSNNSIIMLLLFISTILFQVTALRFIFPLSKMSRYVNIIIIIFVLFYYTNLLVNIKYFKKSWYSFILPGILVFSFEFLNISVNVISDLNKVSLYGALIPWGIFILVPYLNQNKKINIYELWKFFYIFMLIMNILGLLEYYLVMNGLAKTEIINLSYGVFLKGKVSIFHMLSNGKPYFRYYGCFLEPGTLAMYLIPAISYAYNNKKYLSLIIFGIAMFLTYSLGGYISIIILLIITMYKINKNIISIMIVILFSIILLFSTKDFFYNSYIEKGLSATTRENNVSNLIENISNIIINNPIGIKLNISTELSKKNDYYIGSNFALATHLQNGGVLSMLGFLIIIISIFTNSIKNLFKNNLTSLQTVIFSTAISLIPFIFQRVSIFDSSIFGLLYLSEYLNNDKL